MLSLFSGIGGIDLAAQWAGIKTVAFCEIDHFCQKVLRKYWHDVPIIPDVRDITRERLEGEGIGGIDIVAGGFPCQPFSVAGKQRGKEDDRHLWPEMFRIIQEFRPAWVVGENVTGIIKLALDDVLFDLESAGYATQTFIIPACGVGAPHRRERVFIVAYAPGGKNNRREPGNMAETPGSGESFNAAAGVSSEDVAEINKAGNHHRRRTAEYVAGEWWSTEPDVGRVAYGIPNRVDRLRALGNAVVPQQVYPIFQAIIQIEMGRSNGTG